MQESLTIEFDAEQHRGWVRRTLLALTQSFALAGGVLLIGLVAMSMVSIVGRKLFSMPIRGDMELVEVGAAIAIAAFLPLCELRGTHIKVDALTSWLPALARDTLDGIGHLLCCAAAWILAWRTWLQMLDSREFGETTTLLAFPLWIPLLLIVPSLVLLGFCALARIQDICRKAGRRA
ncbi:TRAP transporter small permease [Pseudomonas alkylphenolica]|uniref:TRAP transporter small permease n=1 Tax=Pseudomonas alkylphenolica TaxID=237609 RepID=UPI0018D62AEE|nr:TRAP transporter small permease [Pseudomonas alkylphenolica]MBH3431147.1 TRAP transporter small permease [Pseudomonas alkylphenolica]